METNPTSTQQTTNHLDSAQCPSCGFFVGPMLTCPRCGARAQKRIAVQAVRTFCIIGSIVGVILLWVAAYLKTPEVLHVKDITELTINAMATIKGTVTAVRENPAKKSLSVTINDGTGDINMLAYGKLDEMRRLGRVPRVGDKIEVTGNISASQRYGATIMLAVPERLVIIEPVKPVTISSISLDDVDKTVLLSVTVKEYATRPTRSGSVLHTFSVRDSSGSLNLVMFDATFKKLSDDARALLTESGKPVELFIRIGEYQGEVNGT
ncbi:MAG TPA: OB-fold nucleic acid binding domain-containing protein, partial [bacterium]|nr:OB-fold nucleic acid binding domain-containing protein [bacterium]